MTLLEKAKSIGRGGKVVTPLVPNEELEVVVACFKGDVLLRQAATVLEIRVSNTPTRLFTLLRRAIAAGQVKIEFVNKAHQKEGM